MDFPQSDENTSVTLLGAVGSSDNQADWNRFVKIYEPMLHRWLRFRGVPDHMIVDVVGDVFLKLVGHMPHFVYDQCGTFRGWLRTVVENAATDVEKRAYRRYEKIVDFQNPAVSARCSLRLQQDEEPLEEFVEKMEFRLLAANSVVNRVKRRINGKTWQAFYLTEVEGNSCEDVAVTLKMRPGSVYVARFRVRNYLRTEAEKMQSESDT